MSPRTKADVISIAIMIVPMALIIAALTTTWGVIAYIGITLVFGFVGWFIIAMISFELVNRAIRKRMGIPKAEDDE